MTSVGPSKQIASISPPGTRTLRPITRYPRSAKNRAARSSPSRPLLPSVFKVFQPQSELCVANPRPVGAMVDARPVGAQRLDVMWRRVAFVQGITVAAVLAIELDHQRVAMHFGDDGGGRDDGAACVAFDK